MNLGVCAAALATVIGVANAETVTFDGSENPENVGFDFIVFSDTSWNTDGGSLNLITFPVRGIWFGAFQSNPLIPAANTEGTYVKLDIRMNAGAKEWSTYMNDDQHGAGFQFDDDGFSISTAAGVTRFDTDLTDGFHTFEMLVKNGAVSYAFDGQLLANNEVAYAANSAPILVIGDGSGTTPTGIGGMSIDNVEYTRGPDIDALPTPGAVSTLALAGLIAQRRKRH
ncbi:MAG: hypothetical protein AAGI53_12820 [Planctomycetota bacterium]